MKRWLLLFLMSAFLFGCGTAATKSEFWQHDTMYKNWDHSKFSLWQYKNPNTQTFNESMEQKWWGIEIPHVPAE
ncbi:MAG: hypothetical protein MUO52_00090 [Desulfobacterales bacterium]|nr:hypothetical protein [Desulfobacterales bacterium]